jgi:excisionase family DNA binding protein
MKTKLTEKELLDQYHYRATVVQMKDMRQRGMSYSEIGSELGVSGQWVWQALHTKSNSASKKKEIIQAQQYLRPMLTTREVELFLGISENSVRRKTDDGKIRCYRLGNRGVLRFDKDEVERILKKSRT